MELNDFLTIIAIISSPIIALQVSNILNKKRFIKDQKQLILITLIRTRPNKVAIDHVSALNLIEVVFYGNGSKDKEVVKSWKLYRVHLQDERMFDESKEAWASKTDDLFRQLLYKMCVSLDYNFDITELENTSYSPQSFLDYDLDELELRKLKKEFYKGNTPITIKAIKE